jgi:beta-lactamase regulating signal transducer with metallopeptidase domain
VAALTSALGWSLLHFVWQGLLIGWGASLALHVLRNARPQARYAVACGALLLCAALPLAGTLWRVLAADAGGGDALADAAGAAGPALAALAAPLLAAPATMFNASAPAGMPLLDADQLTAWQYFLQRQLPWLVLLWACGAAVMTLRLSIGLMWVRERTLQAGADTDAGWQQRLDRLALRLGLDRAVRLAIADHLDGPMTAGCWKPVVLVPASLISGMPVELLEALLAHELAHIKRHDYLVNLIQSAIEILLFYHPSVWMLSRHIRAEREQIADDLAARALGEPRRLALALSELDRFQFATPQLAHAAHGGNLMSRIQRLVRPDSEPLSWKIAAPLLGLCAACAMLYAHAAPPAAPAVQAAAPVAAMPALPPLPPVPDEPAAPDAPATPAAPAALAAPAASPAPAAVPAPAAMSAPAALPAPAAPAAGVSGDVPYVPRLTVRPLRAPRAPRANLEGEQYRHLHLSDSAKDAYAMVRGQGDVSLSGKQSDLSELKRLKGSVKGDFIWYRNGSQAYLIQDPALLAKADAAWAPVEKLGTQMDAQSKVMDQHGKVMEELGARMDALAGQAEGGRAERQARREQERKVEQLGRQQDAIGRKMEAVGRRMERAGSDAQRDAIHRELAALQTQMQPLQQQMTQASQEMARQHVTLQNMREPMQALSRQMQDASKPMQELGRKMGELGREQAKASRDAEKTVRGLIQDAIGKGQATSLPPEG